MDPRRTAVFPAKPRPGEHDHGLVFIHMESSLYLLPCGPLETEVADPTYHWVQDRAVDPKLFSVTKEGHLLFQHFQAGNSGKYSCTISYTKHGVPVSQTFHYSVFGYHVLGGLDAVLLFHSKFCEDEWTKRFLWGLREKLRQLEIEQHCKLRLTAAFCFPSLNNPLDEFIIQVQIEVSLFGPRWDERCNSQDIETVTDCYRKTVRHNLGQVQLALTRFFKEHKSFRVTGADIPSINFTNEFVGFLKTERCSGGYGQTKQLQRCLNCCTVSIVHRIPVLLLIILPALLAINFLFILSSCYWFYREYQMPSPRASKMTGSTTRMETVTSFSKMPGEGPQAGPDAGRASDTGHLDTSASQGGDEEHARGAPSPAVTSNLAPVTDETAPVLTLEDRKDAF
ncbi:zona pellucida-binding protein 2-like [Grus japonensis]|uniref:Zona pellucida-binding protein 2-like n=1 Tax=Grus japonensis TaxID=30415 RepID=A0ABC9XMK5_GRUJA